MDDRAQTLRQFIASKRKQLNQGVSTTEASRLLRLIADAEAELARLRKAGGKEDPSL